MTADPQALHAAIARVEAELPAAKIDALLATAPSRTEMTAVAASAIEVLEIEEAPLFDAAAAREEAESSAEILEFSPASDRPAPEADLEVSFDTDEVTVGQVTLSSALYRILCEEAQQHLATLDAELEVLQFDPALTPSQAMIRASHTLCGIHRTGRALEVP